MISEEVRPSARAARLHSLPSRVSSRIADRHRGTRRMWQAAEVEWDGRKERSAADPQAAENNGKESRIWFRSKTITGGSCSNRTEEEEEEEGQYRKYKIRKNRMRRKGRWQEDVQRRKKMRQETYKEERK